MLDYPVIQGVILGFTLSILIGPAFFTLIQTSMHRGFTPGIFLSLGIILSDLTLVSLSYLGAVQIINLPKNQQIFGLVAAVILISFGIYTFTRKVVMDVDSNAIETRKPGMFTYLIKGFFLNIANPFVILFWMGAMGFVSQQYGVDRNAVLSFFAGTLITVFSTDLLKAFIGGRIKGYLNQSVLLWINRVVGASLVLFGIIMLLRVFQQL